MMVRPLLWRWLLPVLVEWAVIASLLTLGCWLGQWWAWPPIVLVLGSRQHALVILGHDAAHYLATPYRRLNDVLCCALCFWPLGIGLTGYRHFHFGHHRWLGTARDPERRAPHGTVGPRWALPRTQRQLALRFGLDLLGLGVPEVLGAARLVGRNGFWDWCGPGLFTLLPAVLLVCSGYTAVVLVWYAALLTSFWACFRLRGWTEHVGTSGTHRVRASWWQRLVFCPHNTWYHAEHHAHPAVPFWALPEVRRVGGYPAVSVATLFRSYSPH